MSESQYYKMEIQQDALDRLGKATPLSTLKELIWNSLDADATRVEIYTIKNDMEETDCIIVKDNGTGINYDKASKLFGYIGDSWKKFQQETPYFHREMHGSQGQGRLKAAALGDEVLWISTYEENGIYWTFQIKWRTCEKEVSITAPEKDFSKEETGVLCQISGLKDLCTWIDDPYLPGSVQQQLCETFVFYLIKYSDVKIIFPFGEINPCVLIKNEEIIELPVQKWGHKIYAARLIIREWIPPTRHMLYWCNDNGINVYSEVLSMRVRGLNFSAHFLSTLVSDAGDELMLGDLMLSDRNDIISEIKKQIRIYHRKKLAVNAQDTVRSWKDSGIYPYGEEENSPAKVVEREVFDIVAYQLDELSADVREMTDSQKKFQFRLLRQAIETNPESVQKIITEVLKLPEEKQNDFAEILSYFKLSSIIDMMQLVNNRINFVYGLEELVFGDWKTKLLERKQLHKLLVRNSWFFGEEFSLSNSDNSLTKVLEKHRKLLINDEEIAIDDTPVRTIDGKDAIVDLVFSRNIPVNNRDRLEHLVVELKRPSVKVGQQQINQIEQYAFAIADDERFNSVDVNWNFWVISNELDKFAENRRNIEGLPSHVIYRSQDKKMTIWVKTWSEMIQDNKFKLETYRTKLECTPDLDEAALFIRNKHQDLFTVQAAQTLEPNNENETTKQTLYDTDINTENFSYANK